MAAAGCSTNCQSDVVSTYRHVTGDVDRSALVAVPKFCNLQDKSLRYVRKPQVGCYDEIRRLATNQSTVVSTNRWRAVVSKRT